ncbi:MAG: MaoC family dehydratase [Turicibacter sp.]|nr:MaoC family dehydratase [Turicibacter sp.]
MKIGQTASFTKTITETDVYMFAGVTGDFNPVHVDAIQAKESIFGERIAHGVLSSGLISAVLGMQLPGPGAILSKLDLKFLAPVKFNDTITATVTVRELLPERKRVIMDCKATNQDGKEVVQGESVLII